MLCTVVLGRGGSEHFAAPQMSKAPNAAQDTGVQWQGSLTRLASMGSNSPMWPPAPGPGRRRGQDILQAVIFWGLSWWLSSKDYTCNAGDMGLIPGWGRSPGGHLSNPLQYSSLGNPMDRGAWWAPVHWVTRVRHYLATKQK